MGTASPRTHKPKIVNESLYTRFDTLNYHCCRELTLMLIFHEWMSIYIKSHWSVKSRSWSAGPTVYSKNMQRTVTMQCLITVIIAAEKFTLM